MQSYTRDRKRDKDVFNLRSKDLTYTEISKKYEISIARVRQIYEREKHERTLKLKNK